MHKKRPGLLRWQTIALLAALGFGLLVAGVAQADALQSPLSRRQAQVAPPEPETTFIAANGLPTLAIEVSGDALQALLDKREEALSAGVLLASDADEVPASLRYEDGDPLSIWLWLAGQDVAPLAGDRWPYYVQIREGQQVGGLRRFTLHPPQSRQWLAEWAYHQALRGEGIASPHISFANVTVNGQAQGIYALEEDFTEELIEAQDRRQGVIVRFDDDLLRQDRAALSGAAASGDFSAADMLAADVSAFRADYIAERPELSVQAEEALGLLRAFQTGQLAPSEVFDAELMGRFLAASDVWGAGQAALWHNLRFYYNPITARLEPIGSDGAPFATETALRETYPFPDNPFFADPHVRVAYAQALARLSQPDYLETFREANQSTLESLQATLAAEYGPDALTPLWEQVAARQAWLGQRLSPVGAVGGSYAVEDAILRVELANATALPVEVVRFVVEGQRLTPEKAWLQPDSEAALMPDQEGVVLLPSGTDLSHAPAQFVIPMDDLSATAEVSVVVRLAGLSETASVPLNAGTVTPALARSTPEPPSVDDALAQHPFLWLAGDGQTLLVQRGEWDVEGDLVLPEGTRLLIPPGRTLRFEQNAVLYSPGPVTILGTESLPVTLTAQADGWSGIVVSGAETPSVWKHVLVEKTQGILRGGWVLTGGITFYESDVTLDHARILRTEAEDGINVIGGSFVFTASEFGETASDAFDGDFATGTLDGGTFHDIGGDAIDMGNSELAVTDTVIRDVSDKALSIGERSTVTASDLDIANVSFGVVSKDLSSVTVERVSISNASEAALAAYTKRNIFGPASIDATDVTLENVATEALAQTGSRVTLDGVSVETTDFEADSLY